MNVIENAFQVLVTSRWLNSFKKQLQDVTASSHMEELEKELHINAAKARIENLEEQLSTYFAKEQTRTDLSLSEAMLHAQHGKCKVSRVKWIPVEDNCAMYIAFNAEAQEFSLYLVSGGNMLERSILAALHVEDQAANDYFLIREPHNPIG